MSFGSRRPKTLYNDEPSLYEYAVGALGRRMRTVAELKRLLRQRVEDSEYGQVLVETVIARLKEQRYLNDSSYAAAFSSMRKENQRFGRQRVISDLKQRGVHEQVIAKAIETTYEGTNEELLARDYLRRKRMKKPSNEKETARIFRAMVRAGFASRTIFAVLKKWDVEDEVLTSLESETE